MNSEILVSLAPNKFRQPFHAEQNTWWAKSGAQPRGVAELHPPHQIEIKKNIYIYFVYMTMRSCDLPFSRHQLMTSTQNLQK